MPISCADWMYTEKSIKTMNSTHDRHREMKRKFPILTPSQVLRPRPSLSMVSVVEPISSISPFEQCIHDFNALIEADFEEQMVYCMENSMTQDNQRLTMTLGSRFFVRDEPCSQEEIQYGWNPFTHTFSIFTNA